MEIETGGPQELRGLLRELVALHLLLADIEESDGRPLDAIHGRHERRSHDGELQELPGGAIDVGAEVQHGHDAVARRQLRRDRRTIDAR